MSVSLEPHTCERETPLGPDPIDIGMYRVFVHYCMFVKNNGKLMVGYLATGKKGNVTFQPTPDFQRDELTNDHRQWIEAQAFQKLSELGEAI